MSRLCSTRDQWVTRSFDLVKKVAGSIVVVVHRAETDALRKYVA